MCKGGKVLDNKTVTVKVEVKNIPVITAKAEELVETLRKAKTIINELASLGIELEFKV